MEQELNIHSKEDKEVQTTNDNKIKSETNDEKKTLKRKLVNNKEGKAISTKTQIKEESNQEGGELTDFKYDLEETNSFLSKQLEAIYFKKSLLNDILNEKKRVSIEMNY